MIPRIVGPRILVEKIVEPKHTSSLIEVVTLTDTPSQFARVIAVGTGALHPNGSRQPIDLKPGDTIITLQFCGTPVTIDGRDHHIIQFDDALAVVE